MRRGVGMVSPRDSPGPMASAFGQGRIPRPVISGRVVEPGVQADRGRRHRQDGRSPGPRIGGGPRPCLPSGRPPFRSADAVDRFARSGSDHREFGRIGLLVAHVAVPLLLDLAAFEEGDPERAGYACPFSGRELVPPSKTNERTGRPSSPCGRASTGAGSRPRSSGSRAVVAIEVVHRHHLVVAVPGCCVCITAEPLPR